MNCIFCGKKSVVVVTTPMVRDVYRKRKCTACNAIFYTKENMITANDQRMKEAFALKERRHNVKLKEKKQSQKGE